jgi:hypothetical protein
VGNIAIAIAIDIQLDRFEFDYFFIGNIVNMNRRKVGITGEGTFAGEFGQGNIDGVTSAGDWER